MKRKFTQPWTTLSALSVVVLAATALAFTQNPKATTAAAKTDAAQVEVDDKAPDSKGNGSKFGNRLTFAPVVQKVTPAVVQVYTTTKAHPAVMNGRGNGNGSADMEDLLRRFFGDQFQPGPGGQGQGQGNRPNRNFNVPRQMGAGSGVIVTKDGYILTNNHVVDGADEVKVTLQDAREFTAKVIGRDPKTDVAVIKIEAKNLPAVALADSDKVQVGDVVLAIGNPFGLGQTVTTGIVSAKGRAGGIGLDYEDFIQTDAAINPGNSGGALVDSDGRLIGINTAILSRSGGNQGIGFAIPVNLAHDVMDNLVKDGHVTRGYLGVMIQDINPALAKEFKLKNNQGALVGDVTANSPASRAGIETGDVILEFNGKPVTDSRHLKLEVARTHPGDKVSVKLIRDGVNKTFDVAVKELPGSENLAKNDTSRNAEDTGTLNGVGVGDLDKQARQQFKVPEAVKGVVVTEVQPDSPSAEAGLQPGDVIQEINRHSVKSAEEAVKMTEKTDDKVTLLRVWRNGGSRFVVVDESKAG